MVYVTPKSEQRILLEGVEALLAAMTPASKLRAVTPSDTVPLPLGPCKAIYVGTVGNLSIIAQGDTAAVLLVAATGWIPVAAAQVMASGTTASDIVAIY